MSEEVMNIFGLGVGFGFFVIFLGIVWWFLCIILFFKVWGMTNDVREIKEMFKEKLDLEHPFVDEGETKENKIN